MPGIPGQGQAAEGVAVRLRAGGVSPLVLAIARQHFEQRKICYYHGLYKPLKAEIVTDTGDVTELYTQNWIYK